MGLGRSAQAGRPSPLWGSVRPPFPCTPRIFNPKTLEAQPFDKGESHSHQEPSTSYRERREISGGRSSTSKEAPQVEKKEDTVRRETMINGAMSSTLMG
jgi:hypothetical protein